MLWLCCFWNISRIKDSHRLLLWNCICDQKIFWGTTEQWAYLWNRAGVWVSALILGRNLACGNWELTLPAIALLWYTMNKMTQSSSLRRLCRPPPCLSNQSVWGCQGTFVLYKTWDFQRANLQGFLQIWFHTLYIFFFFQQHLVSCKVSIKTRQLSNSADTWREPQMFLGLDSYVFKLPMAVRHWVWLS